MLTLVITSLSACGSLTSRGQSTLTGAVIGGGAGAIITGGSGWGTVAGATIGGAIGNQIGK